MIRPSTLGPSVGLGLFACEDIIVPEEHLRTPDHRVELFPFYGPKYLAQSWRILSRQCPTFSRYGIVIKGDPRYTQIDGFPPRTGNLAGYINSTLRSRHLGLSLIHI